MQTLSSEQHQRCTALILVRDKHATSCGADWWFTSRYGEPSSPLTLASFGQGNPAGGCQGCMSANRKTSTFFIRWPCMVTCSIGSSPLLSLRRVVRPGCDRSLQIMTHCCGNTHRCIMHGKAQPRDTNLDRQRQLDEMYKSYKAESFPQVHLYIHNISGVIIIFFPVQARKC